MHTFFSDHSESSEIIQSPQVTNTSSPVHPVVDIARDPLSAATEASASDPSPRAEPVISPENQLTSTVVDLQSSEVRPIGLLSNRVAVATYQDAVLYRNKVMVSNYILKKISVSYIIN